MFIIDIKGQVNLTAQEIPSAVGMRGLHIHGLGDFDFHAAAFGQMLRDGSIRPASALRK